MAEPTVALAVVAGSDVGKVVSQYASANAKEEQLNLESEQRQLQYQEKTLANYDLTNKILDRQVAEATVKGVGLGSPSLEAIQRDTTNISARKQANLNTEEDLFQRNVRLEKQNVQNTFYAQIFGDVEEAATAAYDIKKASPRKV